MNPTPEQIEIIEKIHAQWRDLIKAKLSEHELRKWCVENSTGSMTAHEIFAFVTAPLADLLQIK